MDCFGRLWMIFQLCSYDFSFGIVVFFDNWGSYTILQKVTVVFGFLCMILINYVAVKCNVYFSE